MQSNQSMKPTAPFRKSSACLPRHPAVAYLLLVRPMVSHTSSAPDRAIVAHPPPEQVHISPTRRRIGVAVSAASVVVALIGGLWPSAPQWLFVGGILLIVASVFLLSPYLNIFHHWRRDDIRKLFRR